MEIKNSPPQREESLLSKRCNLGQSVALAVGGDLAAEQHDAFDQAPDAGDGGQEEAGQQGDQQLSDSLAGVAQVEVMHAESAQEDAQQAGGQLALSAGSGGSGRSQSDTAVGADSSAGGGGLATVGAVVGAGADSAAALHADGSILVNGVTTVLTIHFFFLLDNWEQIYLASENKLASEISHKTKGIADKIGCQQ